MTFSRGGVVVVAAVATVAAVAVPTATRTPTASPPPVSTVRVVPAPVGPDLSGLGEAVASVERAEAERLEAQRLEEEHLAAHARAARRATTTTLRVRRPRVTGAVTGGDVWAALARCESGGNPTAHSRSGRYHGAFQFSLATWRSVGMSGDPHTHSYAEQLAAAKRLQARSGWGQWPACARKLGLL